MKDIYILYFFIILITIAFISLSIYFFSIIKQKWSMFLGFLHKKKRQLKKLLYLNLKHDWNIIDWTFNSFVYFYENEYEAIEDIYATNIEDFPNGKIDIVNTYRYITKFRKDNIEDYKNLVINDRVKIFGSHFSSYKFKIDDEKRIHIHPSDNGNVMLIQIHHENALYQLDNEVCHWIINKRKFFGI